MGAVTQERVRVHDGEREAAIPSRASAYNELRTKAIESLMLEKGLVTEEIVDTVITTYERDIGPARGARLIARAWTDEAFKQRLLADANQAMRELGIVGFAAETVIAVENTPRRHNVVCNTLQSCYPWALLGLAPNWYKAPQYRARVVREPRGTLRQFGLDLPDDVEVRVWDSTAEIRYLVVPQRPAGTDDLSEDELAELITRESMIGTGLPKQPD